MLCRVVYLKVSIYKSEEWGSELLMIGRSREFPLAGVSREIVTGVVNASEHRPASLDHSGGCPESSD